MIAAGVAGAGLIAAAVMQSRPPRPDPSGPLYFDAQGKAHGTGAVEYRYQNRAVKLSDQIVDGKLVRSEWFKPDGTSIMVTNWVDGSGEGIYVREDGSVRVKMTYVHEIAEGPATYYAPDGRVLGEAVFKGGQRVSGYEPDPKDQ
jgi:antitoxin component YwqK of YwqJK toxin-antitoxin module